MTRKRVLKDGSSSVSCRERRLRGIDRFEDIEREEPGMATTEERLTALEKEMVEMKKQLAESRSFERLRSADIQELRARYQAHEEYVTDRLNDFEDHVTVRIDTLETRFDTLETRFDALETRFDTLEAHQNQQFQEVKTGVTALAGQVQELAAGQQQILEFLRGDKPKMQA
jgi:uncharacterized protein (DUF3084 family)